MDRLIYQIERAVLSLLLCREAERHIGRDDRESHAVVDAVIIIRDHLAEEARR